MSTSPGGGGSSVDPEAIGLVTLAGAELLADPKPAGHIARFELADRLTTLGTLTAAIGHELNNPLTYVIANLHHVLEVLSGPSCDHLNPELIECMQDALGGAERAARIVRDMRALASQDKPRIEPVDIEAALELAIRQTSNHIRHRAQLTRRFRPVTTVDAEGARLTQVFVNLLLNAAQAIPDGQAKRNEISVALEMQAESVVVQISDSGQGIDPDVLPHVFEPFFTTKPVGEGTGLGLAISRAIVGSYGGELILQSNSGSGTTARVSLPAGKLKKSGAPAATRATTGQKRARILVIDDDSLILGTIKRILGREHDVTTLADSRDTLSCLANNPPFDLLLCDLIMPDMTGMQIHAELIKRSPELANRMLFMSGGAFTPESQAFIDREQVKPLEKPFTPKSLSADVSVALAKFSGKVTALPLSLPKPSKTPPAELALRFSKQWNQLPMVRESCGFFARSACLDVAAGQRVSLVVHELVENAIKYATKEEDRVEVDLRGTPDSFEIVVSNRSSREHTTHLLSLIAQLETTAPREAYLQAMRRCARRSPDDDESEGAGLGLARLVCEAQVQLSAGFSDGRMRVIARGSP
jgi:signal transduction histidine kinase